MPSERPERIAIFANWDLRRGPDSPLIRFVRELEPYWREVLRPEIYAIEGSYRALLRHGLLHDYPHLHALPAGRHGGIVNLANRVVKAGSDPSDAFAVDRVLYFIDPRDPTSLFPDSLALKRECVVTGTTFLATYAAASEWYALQWCAASETGGAGEDASLRRRYYLSAELLQRLFPGQALGVAGQTIALIAHDTRKAEMLQFAGEHYPFLAQFRRRLATGTTGALLNGTIPQRLAAQWRTVVEEAELFQGLGRVPARLATALAEQQRTEDLCQDMAQRLAGKTWVEAQPSGPKGGDIQIADMVREGDCQTVLFFEDPHVSREHEADIQLLERTTRIAECEAVCLHEPRSAREWANNWQRCLQAGAPAPVSVFDAFRRLWGVELVLADLGREPPEDTAQQAQVWRDLVAKAAWYVHALTAQRAGERQRQGEPAKVGVTWGYEMHELLDALQRIPAQLAVLDGQHPALSRSIGGVAGSALHNALVVPLIGIMGTTDPRNEANHNARRLAELLGARSLSLAQFAFCEQRHEAGVGDEQHRQLVQHWAHLDLALLTCDRVKRHFSSRTALPLPESLHQQMASATVAEIGGIYLKHQGEEATPRDYRRVGIELEQLRGVAARGGAVLLAGAQPQRVEPALAALRAGIVSTLVTNLDFACQVLRRQVE